MTRPSTIERAAGRWPGILQSFGVPAKVLNGKHHPCPVCGGDDRFRFDNKDGTGSFFCNGNCGAGYGMQLLQLLKGWDFKTAAAEVDKIVGTVAFTKSKPRLEEKKRRELLNALWLSSKPITAEDAAGRWLVRRLGALTPTAALRFHPAVDYIDDDGVVTTWPCMVAMVTGKDGKPASLHRTFLLPDGSDKAPVKEPRRMMPGAIVDGAAIRLFECTDVLGVAEGIETAFAASAYFGLPVWSVVNSGLMLKWRPPPGIRRVVIFGDNDPKFGGQAAAFGLAHKVATLPDEIATSVEIPDAVKTDWRDVWAAARAPSAVAA